MELDSLKDVWRELGEQGIHRDGDAQIASMLQKRSQSTIAKMKRNLRWELIAVVILYSLTIWYYITAWKGRFWEIAVLLFFVGLFFLFYYFKKNRLLKNMQCVACEVKSHLQNQLATLEKYIYFYFITGTLLTPIAYFVAGLILFFKMPAHAPAGPTSSLTDAQVTMAPQMINQREFIYFIAIGIVLAIGSYFLNQWYVGRLYGQHVKRLKELVQQMEEA